MSSSQGFNDDGCLLLVYLELEIFKTILIVQYRIKLPYFQKFLE